MQHQLALVFISIHKAFAAHFDLTGYLVGHIAAVHTDEQHSRHLAVLLYGHAEDEHHAARGVAEQIFKGGFALQPLTEVGAGGIVGPHGLAGLCAAGKVVRYDLAVGSHQTGQSHILVDRDKGAERRIRRLKKCAAHNCGPQAAVGGQVVLQTTVAAQGLQPAAQALDHGGQGHALALQQGRAVLPDLFPQRFLRDSVTDCRYKQLPDNGRDENKQQHLGLQAHFHGRFLCAVCPRLCCTADADSLWRKNCNISLLDQINFENIHSQRLKSTRSGA